MSITALASSDWQLVEEDGTKPSSLIVELRRRIYVLPYFRFVYAEGDDCRVRIVFASHYVTITGNGLAGLLEALAINLVTRIVEPTEHEASFGVRGESSRKYSGPAINDITVDQPE